MQSRLGTWHGRGHGRATIPRFGHDCNASQGGIVSGRERDAKIYCNPLREAPAQWKHSQPHFFAWCGEPCRVPPEPRNRSEATCSMEKLDGSFCPGVAPSGTMERPESLNHGLLGSQTRQRTEQVAARRVVLLSDPSYFSCEGPMSGNP